MPIFLLLSRYKVPLMIILAVAGLFVLHTVMMKRQYNKGYDAGYTKARQEGEDALSIANAVNRAKDDQNEKDIKEFSRTLADRKTVRDQQEKIINEEIIPAIAAQPDCQIDQTVIDGINALRAVK